MSEIAVREEPQQQMTTLSQAQLNFIASTEFVPPGLRGNLPAIMACVATGRALGIADMTALRSIHIIDGKATFSAELMVQLVRKQGHSIVGEVDDGSATVTGRRRDNGDEMTVTWTLGMAERAGLLGKGNWRKYPEAMLWARAASQLCRMLFADCFAGATYTPEELGAGDVSADELIEDSGPEPSAGGEPVAADAPVGERPSGPEHVPATAAQKKKADVLVGTLRDRLLITTGEVYAIAGVDAPDDPHWSPLRDMLSKEQMRVLIDELERFEEKADAEDKLRRLLEYCETDQARDAALAHADDRAWLTRNLDRAIAKAVEREGADANAGA
jgi:hypothetical protein